MSVTTANVRTASGAKYIRQLRKHWAHKLEVQQVGDQGRVRFGRGAAAMSATAETLTVTIEAEDEATAEELKERDRASPRSVCFSSLVRFTTSVQEGLPRSLDDRSR